MSAVGFELKKNLRGGGVEAPALFSFIIKNSAAVKVGDAVTIDQNGFARRTTAGEVVGGVVAGVTDINDTRLDPDSATLNTYTVASDNQTVAKKKVKIIPALPEYLFKNTASSALTQNTDLLAFADLSDQDTVNQGSLTHTATAQVRIIQIDPDNESDLTQVLVQFVESQYAAIAVSQPA